MSRIVLLSLIAVALAACLPAPASVPLPTPVAATATVVQAAEEVAAPTATATLVVRTTPQPAQTAVGGTPTLASGARNPFGVLIGPESLALERRLALVKALGGVLFRPPDVVVDQWRGVCADCPAIEKSGLRVVLTIRASGGAGTASKPPKDLDAFKRSVLDIVDKRRPELLVVENEENDSELSYAGLPNDYAVELKAACEAAHQRRIRCATGGLPSGNVFLLVWAYYFEKYDSGYACGFAQRTLDSQAAAVMCNARKFEQLSPKMQGDLIHARALLPLYKQNGADYLNFHWYLSDAQALEEAVAYLHTATGLPLMSNEMGQSTDNAAMVQPLLQKALDLNLSVVIWSSVDSTRARALNNPDGSLRASGKAFQDFVQARFK